MLTLQQLLTYLFQNQKNVMVVSVAPIAPVTPVDPITPISPIALEVPKALVTWFLVLNENSQ
jgi:hypothetical protein